jgi:rubrerythrin
MKKTATPAENRTGIAAAPGRAAEMVAATREFPPNAPGDGRPVAAVRVLYAKEGPAPSPPGPNGGGLSLLMDKLGERLAFERTGIRLYEALVSKHEAFGSFEGGPSREDLEHIRHEELEHFHMLQGAIEALGGDPTLLTPSANVQLTASHGVGQILVDPRTTLVQCLEAIATAELTDNECWEALVELAGLAGEDELAARCEDALTAEEEHLDKVRRWLAAAQGRPAPESDLEIEVEEEEQVTNGGARKGRAQPARRR